MDKICLNWSKTPIWTVEEIELHQNLKKTVTGNSIATEPPCIFPRASTWNIDTFCHLKFPPKNSLNPSLHAEVLRQNKFPFSPSKENKSQRVGLTKFAYDTCKSIKIIFKFLFRSQYQIILKFPWKFLIRKMKNFGNFSKF